MNGYDAQDMATQGAEGFRNGYQAGYADAVKAVEVGKPAAAQEAVAYRLKVQAVGVEPFTQYVTDRAFIQTLRNTGLQVDVVPLYAAPVAAAPVDLGAQALHRHLLHMLGAKNHIDAGRIIAELHAASMSTNAAPGIDLQGWAFERPSGADVIVISAPNGKTWIAEPDDRLHMLAAAVIDASPKGGSEALPRAYGYLWHVNHPEDIPAGHPYMSADRAAVEARKELRDMLTHEQRGEGINWVRQKLLADMQATSAEVGS